MGVTVKPKAKRAKKPYRQKYARNDPTAFALLNRNSIINSVIEEFATPLCDEDRRNIEISFVVSLDRLARGKADGDDIANIGFMCNTAAVLCERGFGEEYMDEVGEAMDALLRAELRGKQGKSIGVTGDELADIRRAYQLHAVQVESAGRGHLLAAGKEVTRRQNEGGENIRQLAA